MGGSAGEDIVCVIKASFFVRSLRTTSAPSLAIYASEYFWHQGVLNCFLPQLEDAPVER